MSRRFRNRSMLLTAAAVTVLTAAAVTVLVGGGATAAFAGGPPGPRDHPHATTMYVSGTASSAGADTSCATAEYSTVQSAVNAAVQGDTVYVCAGTYPEQVTISVSHLTLTGAGTSSVIDPTASVPSTVSDLDSTTPFVPIVDVAAGTSDVSISNLEINGDGLSPTFSGCGADFAGIVFESATGTVSGTTVDDIELPSALGGCQDGQGIYVESGTNARADVSITNDTVSGYDKNGITCDDAGTSCTITHNTVTGTGAGEAGAENGIQLGLGASGNVTDNQVSGDDWTGATNSVEPQADFAAGILLYGAGGDTQVSNNTLNDDQVALEVVHADAHLENNTISESGSGITGSVGVFAVPCDYYCSDLALSGGNERVDVTGNQISFPGSPVSASVGIWLGDGEASTAGSVQVNVSGNSVSGADNLVVVGPTATGNVQIGGAGQPGSGGDR